MNQNPINLPEIKFFVCHSIDDVVLVATGGSQNLLLDKRAHEKANLILCQMAMIWIGLTAIFYGLHF